MGLVTISAAADGKDPLPSPLAVAASQPAVASEAAAPNSGVSSGGAPLISPPATVVLVKPPVQNNHRFLDIKNCSGLAALGAGLTGDALSTQKGLGLPGYHEINPIARPFVQSRPGAAVYSAASFAVMGGGMYLAHRTNHHRLERILPFAVAGWEGLLAFRNYHLISTSTTAH
jgi:hypothetical protein